MLVVKRLGACFAGFVKQDTKQTFPFECFRVVRFLERQISAEVAKSPFNDLCRFARGAQDELVV